MTHLKELWLRYVRYQRKMGIAIARWFEVGMSRKHSGTIRMKTLALTLCLASLLYADRIMVDTATSCTTHCTAPREITCVLAVAGRG
jgi:hypothetical protein